MITPMIILIGEKNQAGMMFMEEEWRYLISLSFEIDKKVLI